MNTTDRLARLQALRTELLAITTRTERRTYGNFLHHRGELIADLRRTEAEQEATWRPPPIPAMAKIG